MSTVEKRRVASNGQPTATPDYGDSDTYAAERGEGWLAFSAFMLGLAGTMALIAGIAAIAGSSFYANGSRFVFSDLHTWGWIVTIVATLTLCASFGIVNRSQWARWFGMAIAGLQALAQLMFIQASPFWSLCVFAIDLMVVYALAVYGGRIGDET